MKERKIKMLTGCKTYGTIDVATGKTCSDPECGNCVNIHRLFKEEVERQLEELKNRDCTIPPLDPEKMVVYKRPPTREEIKAAVKYVFRERDNE